jgi:hypothetical protein
MELRRTLPLVIALLLFSATAWANAMPPFADVPNGWNTDRYQPDLFADVGTYMGRADVLGIGISSAEGFTSRPAGYQYTFYNTQGMQHPISGGPGTFIGSGLYIPSTWADPSLGNERTDMWGILYDPTAGADPHRYPIIGFTNYGGAPRYRVWNDTIGWVDLATAVNYDTWTDFSIVYTGNSFDFYINGNLVYLQGGVTTAQGFSSVGMEAYNFFGDPSIPDANPVNYTAYWSNNGEVPEPSACLLIGSGLLALAAAIRYRSR